MSPRKVVRFFAMAPAFWSGELSIPGITDLIGILEDYIFLASLVSILVLFLLVWFGLAALFNGISAFLGYLTANPSL